MIYKPVLANTVPVEIKEKKATGSGQAPKPKEAPKNSCNELLLDEGIQFVSMSQEKHRAEHRKADLQNALNLFTKAVDEAASAHQCCAKALMNRGMTRDLLNQPDLALIDLKTAEQCTSSPDIFFNLAGYHSKHNSKSNSQLGIALQYLEKAVDSGFRDCDSLLKDPDLSNLWSDGDYKQLTKKMLQQNNLFCN